MADFEETFHILLLQRLLELISLIYDLTPMNTLLAIRLRAHHLDLADLVIVGSESERRHKGALAAASVAEDEQQVLSFDSGKIRQSGLADADDIFEGGVQLVHGLLVNEAAGDGVNHFVNYLIT